MDSSDVSSDVSSEMSETSLSDTSLSNKSDTQSSSAQSSSSQSKSHDRSDSSSDEERETNYDRKQKGFRSKYVDIKYNGRLFPTWILANFSKYTLPEVVKDPSVNRCKMNVTGTSSREQYKLRIHQEFITKFLDYNSPYRDVLMYHGLGSGKTGAAIAVYNMLYNYTPEWNVYILIKATMRDDTWMVDINKVLSADQKKHRFSNIKFISYDSPTADKQFMEAVRNSDVSKKSLYIFDEIHLFIRNVYTNVTTKQGHRAQVIYDHIVNDKKENDGVRVIVLSGTPAVNRPFELALLFNLLRPGVFPTSETKFDQMYVTTSSGFSTINESTKNMFQRRIMGLVSYYVGATSDLYATSDTIYTNIEMSKYQEEIYKYYEDMENAMALKKKYGASSGSNYMSYTRQACNFVFPAINQWITGEGRPRPGNFKITEKEVDYVHENRLHKIGVEENAEKKMAVMNYLKELMTYINGFRNYIEDMAAKDGNSKKKLMDLFNVYKNDYQGNFKLFNEGVKTKSDVYNALYNSSPKFLAIVFNVLRSAGPVLIYSNYVYAEGFQILKIYFDQFGFSVCQPKSKSDYEGLGKELRYIEYMGDVEKAQRSLNIQAYNMDKNIHGEYIKAIFISSAGAEGLSLLNVRQVHIVEPFWQEVRITQMIGRALRYCSHMDLPFEERHVDIYRYKSVKRIIDEDDDKKKENKGKDGKIKKKRPTADEFMEETARGKEGLIQSFYEAMKEVAIDCELFKAHNMEYHEYKCFKFNENSLFDKKIGPAYKEDPYDDMQINNGTNAGNSITMRVKVHKIRAVIQLSKEDDENARYSDVNEYWIYHDSGTVYDLNYHYPVGKIGYLENNMPKKLDSETYIIDKMIQIPII